MPKKKSVILRFEPDGMKSTFEKGTTILDALRDVGLAIRSECGGRGVCGKCKVVVQDPSSVGGITDAEKTRLPNSELKSNACMHEALKARSLRNKVKVMVGGRPVTEKLAKAIGADVYCKDAMEGLSKAKELMTQKAE